MKKLFTLILSLCMMATVFCMTAFAVEPPAPGVVMSVSGQNSAGDLVPYGVGNYTDHAKGWEAAIDLARSSEEMNKHGFKRVVVDLYADWTAKADGEFCNSGDGFNWDAIYFPSKVKVTLNMNGHTIDRNIRDEYQYNGEVMYIGANADVIINDGTITGGFSCNGAGGIHINDGANVTLNNVNVERNWVEDDNGAGIALYDGATLTMNGGSIKDNVLSDFFNLYGISGAGIYAVGCTVKLTDVVIENNQAHSGANDGIALYLDGCNFTMDNCLVESNGIEDNSQEFSAAEDIIYLEGGSATITNTDFINNGNHPTDGRAKSEDCDLFYVSCCNLTMNGCLFENNSTCNLFAFEDAYECEIIDTQFLDNESSVLGALAVASSDSRVHTFRECTFNNNHHVDHGTGEDRNAFYHLECLVEFYDCDMGDTTFVDESRVTFYDTTEYQVTPAGSMFTEGSLTMVVAMAALVVSVAALGVALTSKKKKTSDN